MPPAGGDSRKAQRWLLAAAVAALVAAAGAVAVAGSTGRHGGSLTASGGVHVPALPTKSVAPPQTLSVPVPSSVGSPSSPSVISDAALPTLLPDPAFVAHVMHAATLEPIDKLTGPGMFTDTADPAQCVGLILPVTKNAYAGSRSRSTYVQALHDQSSNSKGTVVNGVTTFPSASSANDFVTQQAATWQGCRAAVVLDPDADKPITWTIQDVSQQGDTLTAHINVPGGPACQRALTWQKNVVIDVTACSADPSNEAVTIASAISQRVTQ
jgi:hypothetical protein